MTWLLPVISACFSSAPAPTEPEEVSAKPKLTHAQYERSYFTIDLEQHYSCSEKQLHNRSHSMEYDIPTPIVLCEIVGPARQSALEFWNTPQFYCFTEDCEPSMGGAFACLERSVLTCADLEIAQQHAALAHPK